MMPVFIVGLLLFVRFTRVCVARSVVYVCMLVRVGSLEPVLCLPLLALLGVVFVSLVVCRMSCRHDTGGNRVW